MPHSLRDLACLLPLFYLHGTTFLPEMWEVSPPQVRGRLRWFVPWMAGAGPGGMASTFRYVPGPVVAHTFSRSLPRDPLTCGRGVLWESSLTLRRSDSRKTVVSLSRDKGVCLLPQNFCFFSNHLPHCLRRNTCVFDCLFVLSWPVSELGMSRCFLSCRLEIDDFVFVQGKFFFWRNYHLTEEKLSFSKIIFWGSREWQDLL